MARGLWRNRWAEFGQIGTERVFGCIAARSAGRWEWSLLTAESPYEECRVTGGLCESEEAALEELEKAAEEYAVDAENEAIDAAEEARCRAIEARLVKSVVQAYALDRVSREAK